MTLKLQSVGKWQPGRSGNPRGAPKRYEGPTLAELCKAQTVEAVNTLVVMMRFKGPNQLPAAIAILDRGWGKPVQRVESEESSVHLHLVAARLVEAVNAAPLEQLEQLPQISVDIPTE